MAVAALLQRLPAASPALCALLDPGLGAVQVPIRSELFGCERFARHGHSLGLTHRAQRGGAFGDSFFPRLRDNIRMLALAQRAITVQAAGGYEISPAAEWLLDNFHLVERQLHSVREGLPGRYFRALPVLLDPPLAGLPRIYGVAWAFVAHTDGNFDEDLLVAFLDAYQGARELTQGEVWALPTTLRVLLIENLRRLAEDVAASMAAREIAHQCIDRLDHCPPAVLDEILALMQARGVGRAFLVQLAQRLQDRRLAGQTEVHAWLQRALPDLAGAQAQQYADQTAANLSVGNTLTSLRAIDDADWPELIARTSRLMIALLASPAFAAEDAATRGRTLHAIERLARRSAVSELQVAQQLLGRMQAQAGRAGALASHWLQGPGRATLKRGLGLHEPLRNAWRRLAPQLALPAYLATLGTATVALVAVLLAPMFGAEFAPLLTGPSPPAVGWLALAAALMLWPASEAVVAVVNRLISESLPPARLPRLTLAQGIPAEERVLVAVPAMLTDAAGVAALAHRLLLHHLANPEREAQFALLSDWVDADAEHAPADAPLLAQAQAAIEALNAQYPAASGQAARFLLLHRPRRYSEGERRWIGWERKRGKLEQLLELLVTGQGGAFIELGALSRPAAGTRHLLTLDSDTQLPPGRLRALVGVAAHPDNRPRLSADRLNVVAGYAILQPRLSTPLPAPVQVTAFHRLFAGQCGIDPYSAASSEVYQDLFGEGSFAGKGLLNVQALHAVLCGRLPEGSVLSHDLLEGALARCAVVSDLTLIEDAPFHADVAASRVQRWMRGDWQLLPFLLRPRRWPMRGVNRWKMVDNLRRSLVAPASLGLLVLSLLGLAVSPALALALVAAAYGAGPLMGAVAGLAPSRDDIALRRFYGQAGGELLRALGAAAWFLAQLLQQARQALVAIGLALYRMLVSRRHLLQWTTAAAAQAGSSTSLHALLRRHRHEPLLAGALLAGLLAAGTPHPVFAVALCLLWAASPLWTWVVSRPASTADDGAPDAAGRAQLETIARDTWRLFERCIGPDDLHLPPDNLQLLPHEMLARRTSPTNIGLYLLSTACAREFGWIGSAEMLSRLSATLDSVDRLERHHGHLLNWYDTASGAALLPKYVSAVDSGNLCGHLLAVAQACLARSRQPDDGALAAPLREMAARCQRLAWQPEFGFLYSRRRRLLHIGWRVAEQAPDDGFYDLLASEARLTSLIAIARGDVPVAHWTALGRNTCAIGGEAALRSWSGSMFEYLMPGLMLDEPPGSVLHDACVAALREQQAHAHALGVPWGLSESAYAARDHTLAYQYAPQGVPRLALRRTPADELVVAPYATALAAMLDPRAACRNFDALQALGARGEFGFIEALDFSPARRQPGQVCTPVVTFMAHHQGMSIVALANVLRGGVVRRWGMADPHLEALASLLHERAPREVSPLPEPAAGPPLATLARRAPAFLRELSPGATALAPTQLLSNGRYSVVLRANGAGHSRRGAVGLTRWRDDALRDQFGSFLYLRRRHADAPSGFAAPVSLTQHPAPDPAADYRCSFHADRVCFSAEWPTLHAQTTVWVSPEDDIEFRQVELRNDGATPLLVELISAFEPTLSDDRADEAHPAFMNLFVAAAWHAPQQALNFWRRPRLPSEPALHLAHFLTDCDTPIVALNLQADRQRWLGRNRGAGAPRAELRPPPEGADGTLDTGLDPVCVLAVQLRLAPGATARLTFATAAADDAEHVHAIVDKYRQGSHVHRALLMSATLAAIRLRALRITPENFAATQTLTTALVLGLTRAGAGALPALPSPELHTPVSDRRLLWRFGLSGERPLVLVDAGTPQSLGLLRALAQALRLWAWGGLACDLVLVDHEAASYQMGLLGELGALRDSHAAEAGVGPVPGSTRILVLLASDLSPDDLGTLQALARLHLVADDRPLARHAQAWAAQHDAALARRDGVATALVGREAGTAVAEMPPEGRFDTASGNFRFELSPGHRPSRPWLNVLANPDFGAQISEAGGGYSWAVNSRMNQLTAWSNDPVCDPPSEWFLLQDLATRRTWSVAPSAGSGGGHADLHTVTHGQGHTHIAHRRGALEVSVSWCVDPDSAVKQVWLRLANRGPRPLSLRLAGVAEWMLGATRADRATVRTAARLNPRDGPAVTTLLATQRERAGGFGDGTAFLALVGTRGTGGSPAADDDHADWTCDRRELFDARGRLVLPDHLGRRQGDGLDPCAALSCSFVLAPDGSTERVFLLGWAANPDSAARLAQASAAVAPADRLAAVRTQWDELLGATTVHTPDPLFDVLVNRWLLYQAVACRMWAKAGFYQAGGATGFRDQLQDSMALAWAAPALLRGQILLCASRQFVEGDVQHWWHSPGGAGVRTHFSDDLLWLPHACLHYLRASGDTAVLDEVVPFLDGGQIPEGAEDLYETPRITAESASLYEHAARTIDRSLRSGVHGLPLMGSGDWNDGMNRVGHEGRGESVWLGWFLCPLVAGFAPLARARGEADRATRWETAAAGWKAALLGPAWDGEWFRRAFFDDGQPLGSGANSEARIDLIAQAWAVLSGVAPEALQRRAMAAVEKHLVDERAGLVRLLDPPLVHARPVAGYIQAYPPGVRENGGQYAHAAVWTLMAQAALALRPGAAPGDADGPWRTFTWLSPAHRTAHAVHGTVYGLEPYVMAGDICSQPPHTGRGGWSWYTGAAAWLHRAAVESILGLHLDAGGLHLTPCLPGHWPGAELTLRRNGRTVRFVTGSGGPEGAPLPTGTPVLRPGQRLDWTALAADSCFSVPWLPAAPPPADLAAPDRAGDELFC